MCKCTPSIRTPFCGKGECVWPGSKPPGARDVEPVHHPVQDDGRIRDMPEDVVMRAYEVYCELYGPQPAMVDVAKGCRGGFGVNELISFLYARTFPREQWRARSDEGFGRRR